MKSDTAGILSALPALAPRTVRLLAFGIDVVIVGFFLLLMLLGFVAAGVGALGGLVPENAHRLASGFAGGLGVVFGLAGLFVGVAFWLYDLWLLATRGQTIGKRLLGIRIVDVQTGRVAGLVQALIIRGIVAGLIATAVQTALAFLLPIAGVFVAVADALPILGADRRCLHDYLASTQVRWVKAESRARQAVAFGLVAATAAGIAAGVYFAKDRSLWPPPSMSELLGGAKAPAAAPVAVVPSAQPQPAMAPAVPVPAPRWNATAPEETPPLPEPASASGEPEKVPLEPAASGEPETARTVYTWTDESGTTNFTNDLSTVPPRYRRTVKEAP